MRHDFEKAVVDSVKAYIDAVLDDESCEGIPVVTFFDPMSLDDADRIIVVCEQGDTKIAGPSNVVCLVEVGVKTLKHESTLQADIETHFHRVNAVRDLFCVATPGATIENYSVEGIHITHLESVRRFGTDMGGSDGTFIYSKQEFQIHAHTINGFVGD